MVRSFDRRDFPPGKVAASKRGRRVSVCLPARDEELTIGETVAAIRRDLMERHPVVDELLVVDDGSSDATARLAGDAGARVVAASAVLPEYGTEHGKGQAMWKAVHASTGDLVVFCDADVRRFDPGFVLGLLGPLVTRDDVTFVKGFYDRPLDGRPREGGRVTELMARPLISALFPHLADLEQPLAGECAARRDVLEAVPFVGGYGVDLGLLIDITSGFGTSGLVQCDLGERVHRNRALGELSVQALEILQVGLQRAGLPGSGRASPPDGVVLSRPGSEPVAVAFTQRPPLAKVPAHRQSA
ncbi:MAG: glucosyl-3-phosphoglycerate synthase [Acidimicrobiales bacterium]